MSKDIKLQPTDKKETPIEEKQEEIQQETAISILPENMAIPLLNEITDICTIFQSARNLPETSGIVKDTNFYIEEIIHVLKKYTIIEK